VTEEPPVSRELRLLEEAADERTARRGARVFRRLFDVYSWRQMLGLLAPSWVDQVIDDVAFTSRALAELLALPEAEQARWIESRSWTENGLALADRLLEQAAERPLADRLTLARLAARVILRTPVPVADRLFQARADDVIGRAGLLEVRALRRRGRLDEARSRFVEIEELFAADSTPLYFWLTLAAERDLTAGLLAFDERRLPAALAALGRAEKLFRIAGSEEDDFELLHAQARADLLLGDPNRAVDRLTRAPEFSDRSRRIETDFLQLHAALRTSSPLLARRSALGLLVDLGGSADRAALDRFRVAEAAVRLAEGQPVDAFEAVAGPAENLRAAGSLVGSLRAALVATRAELARKRCKEAHVALRAGVLETFTDLPDLPVVRGVLARILEAPPDPAFLDRLDLWLILAEDSPGVFFPDY
jgi:tetratricopeptide (TPR) repeat protein